MTEQQIEAAARLLCEKRGIDPDEDSEMDFEMDGQIYKQTCPQWAHAADEIRAHHEVLTSIATVMDMERG